MATETEAPTVSAEITPPTYPDVPAYMQWTNRRRMAWASLITMIAMTIALVFYVPINRLAVLADVVTWFFLTMSAVVGSYMGFTTIHSVMSARKQ